MAALPTEIITEILSRLPVKSLLRFKCVCKPWNSLIKSPYFIKIHLNQTLISNSDRHLLISSENVSLHSVELDPHRNHVSFSKLNHPLQRRDVVFFGSCNGILCFSDKLKIDIFLYNPLIKSCRRLPSNYIPEPSMGSVWFGFGYDSKNDDYKVLRMIQKYVNDKVYYNEAKVYSLNTNSWKSIQGIPYYIFCEDYHGVLVNEALHYTVITNESDLVCNFITSFDLNTEKFSLIECPNYNENSRSDLVPLLLEMGGCLCLVANHHTSALYHPPPNNCVLSNPLVKSVDIWMMKEYGMKESWVMLFRICQLQSLGIYVQIKPVFYSKDGRKILLEIDCKGLGWYDLKSKSVERLRAHGIPNGFMEMSYFVEEKQHLVKKALPKKKKKKNDLDDYLSAGFKLRL